MQPIVQSSSVLRNTVLGAALLVAVAAVTVKANRWLETTGEGVTSFTAATNGFFPSQADLGAGEGVMMYSPTATIYVETSDGYRRLTGMATAFEHTGLSYRFVTVAQCLVDDETALTAEVGWRKIHLRLNSWDQSNPGWTTVSASIVAVSDGMAILEAKLEAPIPDVAILPGIHSRY